MVKPRVKLYKVLSKYLKKKRTRKNFKILFSSIIFQSNINIAILKFIYLPFTYSTHSILVVNLRTNNFSIKYIQIVNKNHPN